MQTLQGNKELHRYCDNYGHTFITADIITTCLDSLKKFSKMFFSWNTYKVLQTSPETMEQEYVLEAKQPIMASTGEQPDNVAIKTCADYEVV